MLDFWLGGGSERFRNPAVGNGNGDSCRNAGSCSTRASDPRRSTPSTNSKFEKLFWWTTACQHVLPCLPPSASLKHQHPQSIIVAVPIAAREACDEFRNAVYENYLSQNSRVVSCGGAL